MPTTNPEPDEGRRIRPFAAILNEIGAGTLHTRISEQLTDLTAAVAATGKKGAMTITLTVAPIKAGNTSTLVVTGKSTSKPPEGDEEAPASVFFHDADGNLVRDDPNQPQLPIRGLDRPKEATA